MGIRLLKRSVDLMPDDRRDELLVRLREIEQQLSRSGDNRPPLSFEQLAKEQLSIIDALKAIDPELSEAASRMYN